MSRIIQTGTILNSPASALTVVLPIGSGFTYGPWTELLATTPDGCALLGVCLQGGTAVGDVEIDLGIGDAGAEASVGVIRLYMTNSGTGGMSTFFLPVPRSVAAGVRVAARLRGGHTAAPTVSMVYAAGFDADYATDANLTCAPFGAASVILTPSATPWANTGWVELIASLADDGALAGLALNAAVRADAEWDLAIGAPGEETVVSTLRTAHGFSGRLNYSLLPGLYPAPAGSRVSVRLRKSGTDVTDWRATLLYYGHLASAIQKVTQLTVLVGYDEDAPLDPSPDPCVGGGTVPTGTNPAAGEDLSTAMAPVPWVAITVGGTTYRYAAATVPHTPQRYGLVESFGAIKRDLSEPDSGPKAATMSVSLIDTGRTLRALANSGTLKHAVVEAFVSDMDTIVAEGTPYRGFRGRVSAWQALAGLLFRIDAEDELTARLTSMDAEDQACGITLLDEVSDANPEERTFGKAAPEGYGGVSDEDNDDPVGVWQPTYSASMSFPEAEDLGNNHVFPICVGAVGKIQAVYGASPFEYPQVSRVRIPESAFGDWLWVPTKPGYFGANQYYTDDQGVRWTLLVGKDGHPTVEMARAGRIPFTVNFCGYETKGDTTGNTINSFPRGFLHWINARLLQEGAAGDWPTSIFSLGSFSFIETTSFEAVHDILDDLNYRLGGVLGHDLEFQSWRDRWATWLRHMGYGAATGTNRDGQLMLARLDRSNSYSSARRITPAQILERGCNVDMRADAVENVIRYVSQRNYKSKIQAINPPEGERGLRDPYDGPWLYVPEPNEDSGSIDELGGDIRGRRRSAIQEYGLTLDRDTADSLAEERKQWLSHPNGRAEVDFDMSLRDAWNIELGQVVYLEHWDLPWTGAEHCQVRGLSWDLDTHTVTVRVWHVRDLIP